MSRMFRTFVIAMGLVLAGAGVAGAVPNLVNYQGRLSDAGGTASNGAFNITFSLYAAGSGGAALWTETQSVTVTNGVFNVLLGSSTAFPATLFSTDNLYLGIKVGSDAEMTPRQRFVATPFAQRAGTADVIPGLAQSSVTVGGNVSSSNTTGVVDSVDITVPAGGFVFVQASGETYTGHITGSLSFSSFGIDQGRFVIPSSSTGGATQVFYYGALPTQSYDHNIYISRIFTVASAGTYRYYFNDRFNSGGTGSSCFVQYSRISATYYPSLFGSQSAPQSSLVPAREERTLPEIGGDR